MPSETFVLDENVLIMAIARGRVESRGGRFERVGDDDRGALEMANAVVENGHRLAISAELVRKYIGHRAGLERAGITLSPHPLDQVWNMMRLDRVDFVPYPPEIPLPDSFPEDDRYLAYLALAADAVLVTEDAGVLEAAAARALGFEAVTIGEALVRARVSS